MTERSVVIVQYLPRLLPEKVLKQRNHEKSDSVNYFRATRVPEKVPPRYLESAREQQVSMVVSINTYVHNSLLDSILVAPKIQ